MPDVSERLVPEFMTRRGKKKRRAPAKRKRKVAVGATRKAPRREQKDRVPSLWFNRVLVLCAAAVVVAAAGKAWMTLEALPVQRITVSGELAHTQAEAVQDMVRAGLAGGFLGADLQLMRSELESLPWIFEANVRRRWPSTLEIHVLEQLPIARWGEDGFLNHEGGVFRSERGAEWESLPRLEGPEGSAPALMAKYQRLVDTLAPLGLTVAQLVVDERGQVEAELAGGTRLLLGGADFRERMGRFVALYRGELAPHRDRLLRVDMRYAEGAAVAFAPGQQVAGINGAGTGD